MEKKSQITFFYLQEKLKKGVMLVTFIALSLFTGYQTCKADPIDPRRQCYIYNTTNDDGTSI